jgi:hypothetical protein
MNGSTCIVSIILNLFQYLFNIDKDEQVQIQIAYTTHKMSSNIAFKYQGFQISNSTPKQDITGFSKNTKF